ncbi:MAG: hypothetical protein KC561_19400, partial [Myxococcales bacterium]|nr:hypothetical protein [Myxococcales bacterium]
DSGSASDSQSIPDEGLNEDSAGTEDASDERDGSFGGTDASDARADAGEVFGGDAASDDLSEAGDLSGDSMIDIDEEPPPPFVEGACARSRSPVQTFEFASTNCSEAGWCLELPSTTVSTVTSLWPGEDFLWSVDNGGLVMRYDWAGGFEWADVNTGLQGVTGWVDNLWMVGASGRVLNWNGETLSSVPLTTNEGFNAAWVAGESDVWIGGDEGLLCLFDGENWYTANHQQAGAIMDISGTSPTDIWVLFDETNELLARLVHFDGIRWHVYPLPEGETARTIWASANDDVWLDDHLRFDGETFTSVDSGARIYDIWGSASDDVWFAGLGGYIGHFDGEDLGSESVFNGGWDGIWGNEQYVAVGGRGGALAVNDGEDWTNLRLGGGGNQLNVWVDPDGTVYSTGYFVNYEGVPGDWEVREDFSNTEVTGFHGTAGDDIWAS